MDKLLIVFQTEEGKFLVLLHHRTGHFEGFRVVRSSEGELYVVACVRAREANVVLEGRGCIRGETDGRRDVEEGEARVHVGKGRAIPVQILDANPNVSAIIGVEKGPSSSACSSLGR